MKGRLLAKICIQTSSELENDASALSLNLPQAINSLSALSHSADAEAIITKLIDELIPGSSIRETPHLDITSII